MVNTPSQTNKPNAIAAHPQAHSPRQAQAWAVLDQVFDPEIPVISVCDLGIVRHIFVCNDALEVVLTPTYLGCPAIAQIEQDICNALQAAQLGPVRIRIQRAPAWTTEWISETGKQKLHDYGIAPPHPTTIQPLHFIAHATTTSRPLIACPRCASIKTEQLATFGATACKALYRCLACREPFEYFKPF
ncbi:MAG: phenylacetate-CoA oxygenase subunit PaaJ [Ottowia sp.]|nr:phenylacetate-CoA oxygenase subunit PaaJ [Ottowia sp.]